MFKAAHGLGLVETESVGIRGGRRGAPDRPNKSNQRDWFGGLEGLGSV